MLRMYIPSRELTYPTWGKGKSSSKCHFWGIFFWWVVYKGVSKNRGTPKSSHFNRVFHYFHHPFWDTTIFGNTYIFYTDYSPIHELQKGPFVRRLVSYLGRGELLNYRGYIMILQKHRNGSVLLISCSENPVWLRRLVYFLSNFVLPGTFWNVEKSNFEWAKMLQSFKSHNSCCSTSVPVGEIPI